MRPFSGVLLVSTALLASAGCGVTQGVRYVYQDGEYGVVGIPQNTDRWPSFYRSQAEKLMEGHFPDGHEIVRAEEVVEGSRTLTAQGTKTAEIGPHLPADVLAVAKIGATSSLSRADTLKIKECRIIYRRAPHRTVPDTFAKLATETPPTYIDPNALERRKATEKPPKDEKHDDAKVWDGEKKSDEKKADDKKPDEKKAEAKPGDLAADCP